MAALLDLFRKKKNFNKPFSRNIDGDLVVVTNYICTKCNSHYDPCVVTIQRTVKEEKTGEQVNTGQKYVPQYCMLNKNDPEWEVMTVKGFWEIQKKLNPFELANPIPTNVQIKDRFSDIEISTLDD